MSTPRDHHLRARRLTLGASQFLVGVLAGWPPCSAQSMVSHIERATTSSGAAGIRRVRSALVYLESEPRRRREWQRLDDADAAKVERLIAAETRDPATEKAILDRMVDLLFDGRGEEFDALAARLPASFGERAGDRYLEEATPCLEPASGEKS